MTWLLGLVGLLYPLLLVLGLLEFEPRVMAIAVGVLTLLRWWTWGKGKTAIPTAAILAAFLCALGFTAIAAVLNDEVYLRLLPVLVNVVLLAVALASLVGGRPIVESLARLQVDSLSSAEVRYCRSVTWVWSAFFVLNGGTIAWLAIEGEREAWALYTGFVSYLLIGALFVVEYVYRHYRFRRYLGAPTDALLRRWFPPDSVG